MVLGAGFSAACATGAGEGAKTAATTADEGKVCKRMVATGSNMPQKVCYTPEEWAAIEKQGRQGVEDMDRARGQLGTAGPGAQ
jgi:hypothetical protein